MKLYHYHLLFGVIVGLVSQGLGTPKVDPEIWRQLETREETNILISFHKSDTRTVVKELKQRSFATRTEKLNTLYKNLQRHADETQAKTLEMLKAINYEKAENSLGIRQLWISGQVIVKKANKRIIKALMAMEEVYEITAEKFIELHDPNFTVYPDNKNLRATVEWGVNEIKAPNAWAQGYDGRGIVVANIDTGVRETHETLRYNHRKEYGWYDPYDGTETPNDQNGHGTHTMGTLAGSKGIGVAPGSQWIACKGCNDSSCSSFALKECAQWMSCPTEYTGDSSTAACSMAPHIVSNSWGGRSGDSFYDEYMEKWNYADIYYFFSVGNSGQDCGTAGSPADSPLATSVGSTNIDNHLSTFSSVGPTSSGLIKPELCAPGEKVRSAFHMSDTSYASGSGTSMACPHVAGLAALMRQAYGPYLTYFDFVEGLKNSAKKVNVTENDIDCGGYSEDEYSVPNNNVGHGRVDTVGCMDYINQNFVFR